MLSLHFLLKRLQERFSLLINMIENKPERYLPWWNLLDVEYTDVIITGVDYTGDHLKIY